MIFYKNYLKIGGINEICTFDWYSNTFGFYYHRNKEKK
jgi:hypothetical protein